jgi:sporulation protein YlmC with PRC-barrel domain
MGDLLTRKIVTAEGTKVGHVADIQLSKGPEYKIVGLMYGNHGWFYRLHVLNPFGKRKKHPGKSDVVQWEDIDSIDKEGLITLKPRYRENK